MHLKIKLVANLLVIFARKINKSTYNERDNMHVIFPWRQEKIYISLSLWWPYHLP